MIYDQRTPEPLTVSRGIEATPWLPEGGLIDVATATDPASRYAAVDHIEGGIATLAVTSWPTVDPDTGRLDFGPKRTRVTRTARVDLLQARVDRDRIAAGQLLRPIRVGDVFLVRGLSGQPSRWKVVIDVTRSGRLAAKAALFATAAPAPPRDELSAYGINAAVDEPDMTAGETAPADPGPRAPGHVAYPAV